MILCDSSSSNRLLSRSVLIFSFRLVICNSKESRCSVSDDNDSDNSGRRLLMNSNRLLLVATLLFAVSKVC